MVEEEKPDVDDVPFNEHWDTVKVMPGGGFMFYDQEGNGVTMRQWTEQYENRRIALTMFPSGWSVSTVFLGVDHGFGFSEKPVLWETMVFTPREPDEGLDDRYTRRYTSREDALSGHDEVVAEVRITLDEVPEDASHYPDGV